MLASGRGSNFQAILDAIASGSLKSSVRILITDNKDAYALERAKKHNIESLVMIPKDYKAKDDYYAAIALEMKNSGVELVVLAGFMRVVERPLLDAFPMRVINIHPALLPSFPGLHGQRQAVDYGVKISGCTVHFVDEGVDTGPIIIQAAVPVLHDDTEDTLSARILAYEHRILPEAIRLISEGMVEVKDRKVVIKGHRDAGAGMASPIVL